jgi:ankyrin repeat protein
MLIQAGVDLNSQNEDGNTPLHFAAFKGQVKVIKVLIRHEADTSLSNSMGKTYLHGLNEGYQGEMIRLLD